jgi:hypothetical protein
MVEQSCVLACMIEHGELRQGGECYFCNCRLPQAATGSIQAYPFPHDPIAKDNSR